MSAVLKLEPTDKIKAVKEGHLGWLIVDAPETRNAMALNMWAAAGKVLEDFAADPNIRVVILRGGGDKTFISGGDLGDMHKRTTAEEQAEAERIRTATGTRLRTIEKPTIAMIRGYCLGGGMGFALNCDLRICSENSRFGIPAAKLSRGYDAGGMRQLMDLTGPSAAKEVMITARQYTAAEALRLGMVNQVVPDAELEKYTREYAELIAGNAPLAILNAKTAINELVKDSADRNMKLVAERAAAATNSQDHIEGRNAFLQKRKPVWQGK